jgi:hypothetical protein
MNKRWIWLALGLAVPVVLGSVLAARSYYSDDVATTKVTTVTRPQLPSAPTPAQRTNGIGQPASDGRFTFTVLGMHEGGTTVGDNQYTRMTAQGRYLMIDLRISNTGTTPQTFDSSNQKLLDSENKQYESDYRAENRNNDQGSSIQINPGNTVDQTLVFDLPNGVVPTKLVVHDSAFSGGAPILLK